MCVFVPAIRWHVRADIRRFTFRRLHVYKLRDLIYWPLGKVKIMRMCAFACILCVSLNAKLFHLTHWHIGLWEMWLQFQSVKPSETSKCMLYWVLLENDPDKGKMITIHTSQHGSRRLTVPTSLQATGKVDDDWNLSLLWRHNGRDGVLNQLFIQPLIRAQIKENIKAQCHRSPVDSPHKWPVTWICFHLMTSSCDTLWL